jgi:hypothetical protein
MRGQKKHTFASGDRSLEVFESFIDDNFVDVFASIAAEEADFGSLSAQRGKDPVQDLLAFPARLLWKCEFEIAHSDPAQFGMEKINAPGYADAESTSQWARQDADRFDQQPSERVFESVAQVRASGFRRQASGLVFQTWSLAFDQLGC